MRSSLLEAARVVPSVLQPTKTVPYLAKPFITLAEATASGSSSGSASSSSSSSSFAAATSSRSKTTATRTTTPAENNYDLAPLIRAATSDSSAKQHQTLLVRQKLFSKPVTAHPVLVAATMETLETKLPMIAFIGESNAGKSTLLNSLLNNRKLAFSSGTPGQTKHLFRFEVRNKFNFVDLPGYGFAKVEKQLRNKWKELLQKFCDQECSKRLLKCVVCLVDARKGIKTEDEQVWRKVFRGYTKLIVLTKVDLLTRTELHEAVQAASERILELRDPLPFDELFWTEEQQARRRLYGGKMLGKFLNKNKAASSTSSSACFSSRRASNTDSDNLYPEDETGPEAPIVPAIHAISAKDGCGIAELQTHIGLLCGLMNSESRQNSNSSARSQVSTKYQVEQSKQKSESSYSASKHEYL
ncbi:unnamed protein product, partial [Amoebophrya sp. A120]|eukprot:GSA120T00023674001.1